MAFRHLKICEITADPDVQVREGLDAEKVVEYAEAMKLGAQFPRPVIFFDRLTYWLASGFHRYEAASTAGLLEIDCDVRDGKKRDAILFALSDNKHGVHLSRADKRRAVERILADEEWSKMTDGAIAKHIGVSREFVNRIRNADETATDESVIKSQSGVRSVAGLQNSPEKEVGLESDSRGAVEADDRTSAVTTEDRVDANAKGESSRINSTEDSSQGGDLTAMDDAEFESFLNGLHAQIEQLQRSNDALSASDHGAELMKQMQLLLNAENALNTERERAAIREKSLKWFGNQYAELRKILDVKNDRDVLTAVRKLLEVAA